MLPTNPLLHATALAGPHLPMALLRQYAAGTLAPAAQHRVEAHTLACTRCADVLEGLLQTPASTTDQAVAQLQQRLRQRVQQVAPARPNQRLAPRRPRWLSLQLAAAAALLLSLVAGGWWAWQQRRLAAAAPNAQPVTAATAPPPLIRVAPQVAPSTTPQPAAVPHSATLRPVPLARTDTRRQRRHTTQAAASVASTVSVAAVAPEAVAPAPALAAHLPTEAPRDSATLARAALPPVGRSMLAAPAPALVRNDGMPAARKIAPMPAGGMVSFRENLRREAAEFVPEGAEGRLSGTVQLRLTIGADGKLEAISILRGLRADYDAEAQRLVCEGPAWVPGISGGRRAAQQVDVAVPF